MGPNASRGGPQYDGEDTRLTSKKELGGFYMYGWAAEVSLLHLFQIAGSANRKTGLRGVWNGFVVPPRESNIAAPAHLEL